MSLHRRPFLPVDRAGPRWIAPIPNLLSAGRLLLAMCFPLLPAGWRLPVVIAAGLSDGLDGVIARRFHAMTTAGGLLDAVADKLFALSVLLTLAVDGEVRWWQVIVLLARDLVVTAICLYAAATDQWERFRQMVPRMAGKLTTVLAFVWFGVLLYPRASALAWPLFALTGACSVLAAGDYLYQFVTMLAARQRERRHAGGGSSDVGGAKKKTTPEGGAGVAERTSSEGEQEGPPSRL